MLLVCGSNGQLDTGHVAETECDSRTAGFVGIREVGPERTGGNAVAQQ